MTTAKQLLLSGIDYSTWANRRLLDICATLTTEEQERDLGASHRSVLETLRHIYYVERVWCKRLIEDFMPPMIGVGDPRRFHDPDPEPGIDQIRLRWPDFWQNLREWLFNLPESELDHQLSSALPNGNQFQVSRWQMLLHAINHSTLHRGQVISLLRALGKQPPNLDIFSFYVVS